MNETVSADKVRRDPGAPAPLETVELSTGPAPSNSVIWLHGLGADGHDFEPVVPLLGLERIAATRFVFPHAGMRPVTLNGGMVMRAWYDIRGMEVGRDQDEEGIAASADQVTALVEREIGRGVPAERIVLAGFSQGAATAAHVAMRYPRALAGLVVLSGYLLFPERLAAEAHLANRSLEVFVGHGLLDPVVPAVMGRDLAARLEALGMPVRWREYPIPHSVSQEELLDIGAWLRARLGG